MEAFRRLPSEFRGRLVLVGDGPLRPWLAAAAEEDRRIVLVPHLADRRELARHLASADIYVSAGPHETFGLAILEAQACGLPVVGVAAGALTERVPDPAFGLLGSVDSVDELAANILELSRDGYVERGRHARRRVGADFSWEVTFRTLFDVYEGLFASAPTATKDAAAATPVASGRSPARS